MNIPSEARFRKTRAFLTLAVIAAIVGGSEWFMRRSGYLPGRDYFDLTKDVVVSGIFATDDRGVFKADKAGWVTAPQIAINSDGFRGPEFTPPDPGQESILLLGDSFAWGIGADPISNSYADLVRDQGYRVYNTGIPGVDAGQYQLIADLYTPKLKPDHVVVSFYVGNDLLSKLYPIIPNRNLIHVTNAGWILGFDACDKPLTAQESYDYYIGTTQPMIGRLLLSTSIGTAAWNLVRGAGNRVPAASTPGRCADGSQQAAANVEPNAPTFAALHHIKDLATRSGSAFHLLVIPTRGQGCSTQLRDIAPYKAEFDRLDPIYLEDIPESGYYDAPNCHVRNEGHRFIADRLLARLTKD